VALAEKATRRKTTKNLVLSVQSRPGESNQWILNSGKVLLGVVLFKSKRSTTYVEMISRVRKTLGESQTILVAIISLINFFFLFLFRFYRFLRVCMVLNFGCSTRHHELLANRCNAVELGNIECYCDLT
jgi:hypothetical protein